MMPTAPVPWRKTLRAEAKGAYKRHKRTVETSERAPGSTWFRRHWGQMTLDERTALFKRRGA